MTVHRERINALVLIDKDIIRCIFASCSDDKTIRMWVYGRGGIQIKFLERHTSQVYDILKYNDKALISASGDTTAIYNIPYASSIFLLVLSFFSVDVLINLSFLVQYAGLINY